LNQAETIISQHVNAEPKVDASKEAALQLEITGLQQQLVETQKLLERYKSERNKMIKMVKEGHIPRASK
jgi:hypothetical protein